MNNSRKYATIISKKGMYGSCICSHCDKPVRADSNYCWYCGCEFNHLKYDFSFFDKKNENKTYY